MRRSWAAFFTLTASLTSSSHQLTALLHKIRFFPMTFQVVPLTNCSHPSVIFAPARFLSISVSTVPTRSNNSANFTAFFVVSSRNSCRFSYISSLSILHLYNFLLHPLLFASVHLAFCPYQRIICCSSHVLHAYTYFHPFTISMLYDYVVRNGASSFVILYSLSLIHI